MSSEFPTITVFGSDRSEALECLMTQFARVEEDGSAVIVFEDPEVNETDTDGVKQMLIHCPIEGCSAELEVFAAGDKLGIASDVTQGALQAASFICKQAQGSRR